MSGKNQAIPKVIFYNNFVSVERNGYNPQEFWSDLEHGIGEHLVSGLVQVPVEKIQELNLEPLIGDSVGEPFEKILKKNKVVEELGKFSAPHSQVRVFRSKHDMLSVAVHVFSNGALK